LRRDFKNIKSDYSKQRTNEQYAERVRLQRTL
jgi:hypothetical protein